MSTRLDELNQRVEDARSALQELEVKVADQRAQDQHEVVEELEAYISDESLKREGLLELSEEAWQEAKDWLEKLIHSVKLLKK